MAVQLHGQRIDPFTSMAQEMGKWMDRVLGPGGPRFCPGEVWSPAVNAYEYPEDYRIVVELAGVRTEDLDLRIEDDALILSGVRATPGAPQQGETARLHTMEIDHGRFSRKLPLPADIVPEGVEANYRNGYLWIRLPRKT